MRAGRWGSLLLCCAAIVGVGGWLAIDDSAAVRSAEEVIESVVDPEVVRSPRGDALSVIDVASAVVWAVGDGDGGEAAAALAQRIRRSRPDLFLYLGDVYPRGTPADFARNYAPTYGQLAGRTAPTSGNHDWSEAGEGYVPYWDRALGRPLSSYYAVRIAGWEVLSLNSEAPHDPGSPQLEWLRARLRGDGTCRLAFWHRPRFSAGTTHGDQPDVAPLWDALRGHARIVVNGHEHDSQRFRPLDGIAQLVAGAGGHGLYPLDERDRRLAFGDASHFAALRLALRPGVARFAFVSAEGRVLDRGRVRCRRQ